MSANLIQAPALLRLNAEDNVLVSTRIVEKGETPMEAITTTARIMRGHKMARWERAIISAS